MKRFTALLLCLVTLITATITVYADSIQPFSNNVNSTEVFHLGVKAKQLFRERVISGEFVF